MSNNETNQLPQNSVGKSGDEKPIYIHRAVRNEDHPYFITNRATAQDTTLTYEAAGLLWYLLSKPDTWKVIPVTLQRKGEGKKKGTARGRVYNLLNELIEARYIERIYHRDSEGKVADVEYIIHERPHPLPALQEMEDQEMEKQHNRNKRKVGSKEREKKDSVSATQDTQPDTPNPAPKQRPMYDAVFAVWGHIGGLNGDYQSFLLNKATKKQYKDCNVEPPVTPDELLSWNKWYRQRNMREGFIMLNSASKIQSSIAEYRRSLLPKTNTTPDDTESPAPDATSFQERLQANLRYSQMMQGGNDGDAG